MATRQNERGRVLGGGRSSLKVPQPQRPHNARILSPSESSTSLSNSQISGEDQDLTSRVSLETSDTAAVAAASSRLICPICNEDMVTLLQLNRHLDDDHQNLEEVEQDEIKNWFKTQVVRAKRFQPLAVLNQRLKGLEVFESNDVPATIPLVSNGTSTPQPVRPDADEVVTRKHWQRSGVNDVCSEPMCGKGLGPINGSINCRKCGRLFCEEHTFYQMKLSRSAQHEPIRGYWSRCCETCYKSREGYNDLHGPERNDFDEFAKIRRKVIDKQYLEVSRLEKRLSKLTQALATLPSNQGAGNVGLFGNLTGNKAQRKLVEQSVVVWEEDLNVSRCPFCQQDFNNYTFRRHHCRICGRVICADPRTNCSTEVGLNVAAVTGSINEKNPEKIGIDIRMCRDCQSTLFSKRDFEVELRKKPADLLAYENLKQFERGIRLLLPKLQRLIAALQDADHPPTAAQIADAKRTRKRLTDSFTQYDVAARRIRDLPSSSRTQLKLQASVYAQATNFLHLNMLPLKHLPKLLKHATPHGHGDGPALNRRQNIVRPSGALESIKFNDIESASQVSSSSAVSALEAEEKELRERLMVLEEQKFFVTEMIADASKRRKFDEVSSLAVNVEDLSKEIDQLNGMLGQLDFKGAYEREQAIKGR